MIARDSAGLGDYDVQRLDKHPHAALEWSIRGFRARSQSAASSLALVGCLLGLAAGTLQTAEETLKILKRPLHDGRIGPMLFGNFIELLDDLVAGGRK
jgi:hypothetical protein